MAYESPHGVKVGTVKAAADLSTHQYKFVKVTSTGINIAAALTDYCIGVQQGKAKSGDPVEIVAVGVTKCIAGGTVTAGDKVGHKADGTVIVAVTGGTAMMEGVALTGGASGETITIFVRCPGTILA